MTTKPLLFLNIDGVLTSARTYALADFATSPHELDPVALSLLAALCQATGARVIISSAWVAHYTSAEAWVQLFKGLGHDIPVVDVVTKAERYADRGTALRKHVERAGNPAYVVLDDGLALEGLAANWVQVDRRVGLGVDDAVAVLRKIAPGCRYLERLEYLATQFSSES